MPHAVPAVPSVFGLASFGPALVGDVAPARGAPLGDAVAATAVAAGLVVLIVVLALRYRRGGMPWLRRVGAFSERVSGLPGWAAVPLAVTVASLLPAVFGFYWDVSWHIDRGRDPGPFANPAHWFIIVGLAGIAVAGVMAVAAGADDGTPTAVGLRRDWPAPVGGVLLLVCGGIALAGFPLDDVWHRLFGQDVTLWGPTHIQMIGGASLATLASWALVEEGRRRRGHRRRTGPAGRGGRLEWLVEHRDVLAGGSFLLGLSTLQGEFDFGVPQFRQLYHPVLIMLAAGIGLVAVRIHAGRGGALRAALFFLVVRGVVTLLVGPVLGRTTLHFPLYVVEAVLVELVALRISTDRQVTFGLWSGFLIGTVGLAAEWGWSQLWMPLPWRASLLPEGAVLGLAAAVAGGVLGGLIGRALAPPQSRREPTPRGLAAGAWLVAAVVIVLPMPMTAHTDWRAAVTLVPASPPGWMNATVRLDPPDAAEGANWFDVTAWQGAGGGDGGLVLAGLEPAPGGQGTYRTTEPFPVGGSWKTLLRVQGGSSLQAAPIFLPEDEAIPAHEVPALARFDRPFQPDKEILQREAVGGSVWLERLAYAVLVGMAGLWIGALAWGLRRMDRHADEQVSAPGPGLEQAAS